MRVFPRYQSIVIGMVFACPFLLAPSIFAQFPGPTIPLDPGNGGRSISIAALKPGDIIVSTTDENVSKLIRVVTNSEVSHVSLFIGNNNVIEAVEAGVTLKTIDEALNKSKLAVAFRLPTLDALRAKAVTDFAFSQLGKKYNFAGLIRHPRYGMLRENCNSFTGPKQTACKTWEGMIRVGAEIVIGPSVFIGKDEFFCSQLIGDAYKSGGIDLFKTTAAKTVPGDIPVLERLGDLKYVGHLKTP